MNIDQALTLIDKIVNDLVADERVGIDLCSDIAVTVRQAQSCLQADELPQIKTCVDITAEKLTRFIEGQAPWDPRGELMFFKNKETPDGVMWLSRYRIGIHALSVDGVGVTNGDKYRLSLRNRHEGRKEHRRWNEAKAAR